MYESHYGLTAKPFSIVPNPEILFLSKHHQNALTYLEYGLSEKVGFILLTGEIGAGKTTLIRYMLNKIESEIDAAVIFNTNFTSDQMLRRILSEFEIPCETTDKERHLQQFYQFLIDRYAQGRHVLLIVDEAQNLSDDALEDIRMLSNLQTDDRILLQIMLVGQPELKNRLNMPAFQQLAQRIAVNFHITPLDEIQTRQYIDYRIRKAGGEPDLFSSEAIKKIYTHSGGIPRSINLMCDTALVYGFADNLENIDTTVIEKVVKDKVCMSVSEETAVGGNKKGGDSGSLGQRIMERIHLLERSLSELKQQHEDFTQAVQGDLLIKYQQLLANEQNRFDQLMAKYTQVLQVNQTQKPTNSDKKDRKGPDGQDRKIEAKTKFARLLKMEEAKQALKKERESKKP